MPEKPDPVRKARTPRNAEIGTAFNIILFLIFILCALFTVLIGARVYENIHTRNQQNYSDYVILHYVANKVRQGDTAGSITTEDIDGIPVLNISEKTAGTGYVTRIYAYEGSLRELFMRDDADLTLADGLKIADCSGLDISEEGDLLKLGTKGDHPRELTLALKCGEGKKGGTE